MAKFKMFNYFIGYLTIIEFIMDLLYEFVLKSLVQFIRTFYKT